MGCALTVVATFQVASYSGNTLDKLEACPHNWDSTDKLEACPHILGLDKHYCFFLSV